MKVFHCVLLVVLLLMPSGCEAIRSLSTITTSALTEHDLPNRYGITLGREGGSQRWIRPRALDLNPFGPDRAALSSAKPQQKHEVGQGHITHTRRHL